MNREEALNCHIEIVEQITKTGPKYQGYLRAPQAGAILYSSGWCQDHSEAERRARAYWRNLLRTIPPDLVAPFV